MISLSIVDLIIPNVQFAVNNVVYIIDYNANKCDRIQENQLVSEKINYCVRAERRVRARRR